VVLPTSKLHASTSPIFHTNNIISAVYVFMGGLLMLVGGILEWVLGNSFPACVFCSFGGFWFSYGGTLIPAFGTYAAYAPADAESAAEGLTTTGFNASLGKLLQKSNGYRVV
jgi:succinate-acetate transporter protein